MAIEFWTLWQHMAVVSDFCKEASDGLWEAMEDRLATLMQYGNRATMPVSEALGDGLFALRANYGNQQGRLLYFFGPKRRQIIFVHAIQLKKTRRIPQADIDDANAKRQLALAEELRDTHEFTVTH